MRFLIRHGGFLALLFFGMARFAWGQTSSYDNIAVINVTNVGPQVASEELIRANIHVKPGDRYIRSSVDQDVLNLYNTGFFSNIRVTDQRTDRGVILTYILQGKYRVRAIDFQGNTKYSSKKLLKKVSTKVGDPVDERKLFNDCQEIEKLYEKAGYQHTTVKYVLQKMDNETGRVSVLFEIQETPKVKILRVDFVDAHAFSQRQLRRVIKTRRHWMWSWLTRHGFFKKDQFEEDQETLADFYRKKGYIDFEIKDIKFINPEPNRMVIEIHVNEGNLYKVGSVTIKGNQIFTTEQIIAGLKQQHAESHSKTNIGPHGLEADVGMTFTPDALSHDIQAIEDFYGGRGYIHVRQGSGLIVKKIPNTETGTIDLEYDIKEDDKVYIERIVIKGNVKTKDKVIRRELAVSPGDVFDMVRVRRSKERLEGLGFFERVDTKPVPTETGVANRDDLIVGVDEKNTGQFSFGAGFNSIESLFAYAEVSQANFDLFNPPYFTGGGQKFRLRVQVGLLEQDYEVSFVEPWFLNRHLRFGVDLYHSVLDYLSLNNFYDVTRTGMKLSLTRALGSERLIGSVSYTLEDVGIINVNTNAPETILKSQGDRLLSRFGASIAYDTRNSYELSNKGQRTALSGLLTVGDQEYYKLELSSDWFFRGFRHNHVLELSGRAGVTQSFTSEDVPFFDRFYLGGQDTLRGFDYWGVGPREVSQDGSLYEPIGGDTYWFMSAEYTIPIIDRVSVAFFYDVGNVSARPWSLSGTEIFGRAFTVPNQNTLPFQSTFFGAFPAGNTGVYSDDYGVGLRLVIPYLGPLRLDYGIPLKRDSFNGPSGKFNFGVGYTRQF